MEKQHCDRLLCWAGNIFCINTNIFHVSHHQLSLCEFVTVIVCMWCCETASPHSILLNTDWMSQFYRMTHMTHTNTDHHPLASNPLRPGQISAQISHNSSMITATPALILMNIGDWFLSVSDMNTPLSVEKIKLFKYSPSTFWCRLVALSQQSNHTQQKLLLSSNFYFDIVKIKKCLQSNMVRIKETKKYNIAQNLLVLANM